MFISAELRFLSAVEAHRAGDLARADRLCAEILSENHAHADAWHLRGLIACMRGDYQYAIGLLERALAHDPRQGLVEATLGAALAELRRPGEALVHFERALALNPGMAESLLGRAAVLIELQRFGEAIGALDRFLEAFPSHVHAWFCRGNALLAARRPREALGDYQRALELGMDSMELLNQRGNALRELNRSADALASYRAALARAPDSVETLSNCGAALLDLARIGEALDTLERALRARPDSIPALENHALGSLMAGRVEAAVASYGEVYRRAPRGRPALSNLLKAQLAACDWTDFEARTGALLDEVERGLPVHPFVLMNVCDDPRSLRLCAERFAEAQAGAELRSPSCPQHRHERLRVAYVSADFRDHAVGFVLAGVLEQHDASRVETILVDLRPEAGSAMAQRLRTAGGGYLDGSSMSDQAIASRLRELEVDVAVDLMGYTQWSRPAIFAQRAAPVQVNFLGYPGTTGAPWMQFLLADEKVVPVEAASGYRERIWRLPHCYLPCDDTRRAGGPPARAALGLPPDGLVLCAFSAPSKLNPRLFDGWLRLLLELPSSVLWLRAMDEVPRRQLADRAERCGVDAERLVWSRWVASEDYLAQLAAADLFLDTFPYNAHSTAMDALFAGLPVVTCRGRGFASRVAGSLLAALDLEDCIGSSLEDYQARALALARDPERRRAIRHQLERARRESAVFDTAAYTHELETALEAMHRTVLRESGRSA